MAKPKTTAWLRFGRSGDTIDGRVIKASDISEAAESYDPNFYTALIWPDHQRWFNMGKVVAVRAEKNNEGGMDLFGQIEANDIYRSINASGQRLFTSMELFPNFRKTEKTYLSGLGATDSPASVATSEVHLSRIDEPDVLVAQYQEAAPHDFDDSQVDANEAKNLLASIAKFFKNPSQYSEQDDEDTMSKQALEALQGQLSELTNRFNAAFPAPNGEDASGSGANPPAQESTLEQRFNTLLEEVNQLKSSLNKGPETDDKYEVLKNELKDLTDKFTAALQEQPGTNGGEHDGDGKDLSACI